MDQSQDQNNKLRVNHNSFRKTTKLQSTTGPITKKSKSMNLSTWVSSRRFNKTKMILVAMIFQLKTRNLNKKRVKKAAVLMKMMIFLVMKGQEELLRSKPRRMVIMKCYNNAWEKS